MIRKIAGRSGFSLVLGLVCAAFAAPGPVLAADAEANGRGKHHSNFVTREGSDLYLQGRPFRFVGSNNYYPIFKSQFMVDSLFESARDSGFQVMRVWGMLDIGNEDGSNSVDGNGAKEGVYFQYWDGTAPAINDGENGLQRLDYVVYKAGQAGLKLVIPFVNNWREFGGMDQYVRWRGGQFHDEFYTDPAIRGWYKNWISHVLNRVNTYTGVQYKNDPTIMTWELANEPRCRGSGVYPSSSACTTTTLVDWAREMSAFIKSIDRNHLVSVGDEGFYCIPGATDFTENCSEGVDSIAFARLPHIDVMSMHLYPDHWGKDVAFGTQWISRHIADAKRLRKAVMLGEFGFRDRSRRNPVFQEWTNAVIAAGGNGALYWILSDLQDDGSRFPDFDGFTVYCPSPVCSTMSNFGTMLRARRELPFAPIADDDSSTVPFATAATLSPLANDIAYFRATLTPGSIDLDPAAAGQQTARSVPGGSFVVQANDAVSFTPAEGFSGNADITYTVADSRGKLSNAALLRVTVRPDPNAALMLFSFESGLESWAPGSWQTNAGTLSQSAEFVTHGTQGLRADTVDGGWFGLNLPASVDISGKTRFKIDLRTGAVGTSTNVSLQLGSEFTWCEGNWGFTNENSTATIDIDLNALNCTSTALNDVRAVWVWFSGGGTFHIDAVRAE
jgi:mannan endo-1,4-beta-mannosidase